MLDDAVDDVFRVLVEIFQGADAARYGDHVNGGIATTHAEYAVGGVLQVNWKQGGYIKKLNSDPWKRDYLYLNPGEHGEIDIFSYGADGSPGGEGPNADIGSWDKN